MDRRHQILALSGGGYRGVFTASILAKLEREAGGPLRERFDLIAGTSIGGLIACGLAVGRPAAEILSAMREHGEAVFDRSVRPFGRRFPVAIPRLGLFGARYGADGLRKAVGAVLGGHAAAGLGNVAAPLIVVGVNRTQVRPRVFRSAGIPQSEPDTATLMDAALSTSAAPTYFPEHQVGRDNMIDGGLIANAPDLLGLVEAMSRFGAGPQATSVLSIGTAGTHRRDAHRPAGSYGVFRWFLSRRLFHVTVSAQERLSTEACESLLGDRYVRIDREPSLDQSRAIGLDRAGSVATGTLEAMADDVWGSMPQGRTQALRSMMRHRAGWAGPG